VSQAKFVTDTRRVRRARWLALAALAVLAVAGVGTLLSLRSGPGQRLVRRALHLTPSGPPGIIIHHSDTPGVVRGQPVTLTNIAEMHRKRGFGIRYRGRHYTIGYHYVILPNGVIQPGRPENCPGAHAATAELNRYLGICLIGDFSLEYRPDWWWPRSPTPEQMQSLTWLCHRLMTKYGFGPESIMRHSDVRQTECPGNAFPFFTFKGQLAERLEGGQPERTARRP
jgi:hypothetical protein